MRLFEINLIGKTVLVNLDQIAFIEKDQETGNAVITMSNGERYQTNEDFEEFRVNIGAN